MFFPRVPATLALKPLKRTSDEMKLLQIAAAACLFAAPSVVADDAKVATKAAGADDAKVVNPFHGNEKCPITGRPIDKKKSLSHEGQKVYFCCAGCQTKGKADVAGMVKKAYTKVTKIGNEKCPISGQVVPKGKGKTVVFQGKETRVCCGNCAKAFTKTPNLNLTKALNPKLVDLKNTQCPVMTKKAVKPDMFVTYKGKIIHLCCPGCDRRLQKDPKVLDKLVQD